MTEELDGELLERLRRSGLRLDRDGRWWHEGQPVEHVRLAAALHRWLDRLADGRYVIRPDGPGSLTGQYAYVEVEDAPYVVRSLRCERARVVLRLSDGSEEQLAPSGVAVGDADALYCVVKGGRFEARLSRQAQLALAEQIEEGHSPSGFVLVVGGDRWPIGSR